MSADSSPPQRTRAWRPFAAWWVPVGTSSGIAYLLGIAGWQRGGLLIGVPLVAGGSYLAWKLASASPSRTTWTLAAGLLCLTASGVLVERAPLSKGALAARMDRLDLPFFEQQSEKGSGHSWCVPDCPSVTRIYKAPNTSVQAAMVPIGISLLNNGVITNTEELSRISNDRFLRARTAEFVVEVRIRDAERAKLVEIKYAARRK